MPPTVLFCPKCQHRVVVMELRPGREERCGRCGTPVPATATAPAGVDPAAPPAARNAPGGVRRGGVPPLAVSRIAPAASMTPAPGLDPADWQNVRRGLVYCARGVRLYVFAGILGVLGVVLWVYAREAVRQVPAGGSVLAVIFALPAMFVLFLASTAISGGRLYCLAAPRDSGLHGIALAAAAGAILTFVDAFVVALPVVLFPLAILVHAGSEVAFLFFLAGIGARFGDTALAANAKRFLALGGIAAAIGVGACAAAAWRIATETPSVVNGGGEPIQLPPTGGTGLVVGLVLGIVVSQWLRLVEAPRLKLVGLSFIPGALVWSGGGTGAITALLGIVAAIALTFVLSAYLALLAEATACIPERR